MALNGIVRVALGSPYLRNDFSEDYDQEYVRAQMENYGYDPKNFNGEDKIVTEKHLVLLETPKKCSGLRPHVLIMGSTEEAEEKVAGLQETGVLVARYSIFYGGPSQYTGNYPEDSGYALDLPKNIKTARAFIGDDAVLDALVAREESRIRKAVEKLNASLSEPILITPYLSQALRLD